MKNEKKIPRWLSPFLYFGLQNKAYEFIENLSYFLSAGLSLSEALESLKEETSSKRMKKIIVKIKEAIDSGEMLSTSLTQQNFFEEDIIEIIHAGELSGNLVNNLKLVVLLHDKDRKLKAKINSSLLYGGIILVATMIGGVGTAWFSLPQIAKVYADMNVELPMLTRILVQFGVFVSKYGYIFFPIFFLIVASMFYFLFSFPKTKFIGNIFLFHIPFVKKLIQQSEVTRFGYLMGNISQSGLSINRAFQIMVGATTFDNYKKLYEFIAGKVTEGISISESFKMYPKSKKLIPSSVLQMLTSAEKTGKLSETFFRISDLYELKLENTSRNLPIIIEPLLLILMGLGVVIFILATMLPIYNLTNIIK
ncbi:MAG: type II secretion system F family protein [Candidatus Moraniibacteriota bacterium]|nr:MAG: type II secretion system F family protein [Candidatus Moranbacteria bacterium]